MVDVTQADREAAFLITRFLLGNDATLPLELRDESEGLKRHFILDVLARHRTRAEPDLVEAAQRVLEWWPEGSEENSLAGKSKGGTFAADIQALRAALIRADGEVNGGA